MLKNNEFKQLPENDIFHKYQVVVHCDSRLTLTARKIFNVLISINYGNDEVHKISESEVIKRLGKSKKHIGYYREQFLLLGKTNFDFFGVNENNKKIYGTCSILSGAIVDEGNQQWIYSTPSKIMEWIKRKSDRITLSLSIQDALNSKYSLALYEEFLCKLEGSESVISLSPDQIRFITCGNEKHNEYKYLKKQVIKPSIDELSENSNLTVSIQSEERTQRKISLVNFLVTEKSGSESEANIITKMNQEFGIDIGMARKLVKEYKLNEIEQALTYTEQKLKEGAIVALKGRETPNVGGFSVNAIRNNMAPSSTNILNKTNNLKNDPQKSKPITNDAKKSEEYLKLFPEQEESLKNDFLKKADSIIKKIIEEEGYQNPIVRHEFLKFVASKKNK